MPFVLSERCARYRRAARYGRVDMPVVCAFRTQIIFIVTQKSPTHFLSDCVLPHPPPTTMRRARARARARALIFYGTTQFMVRFLPKFACYTAARIVPAMRTALVSTSRSRLSVIASRKAGGNFCKWSHSLSTTGSPRSDGGRRRRRRLLCAMPWEFIKTDDPPSIPYFPLSSTRLPNRMFKNNLI